MADAYARTNQAPAEFALYDELLAELLRRPELDWRLDTSNLLCGLRPELP